MSGLFQMAALTSKWPELIGILLPVAKGIFEHLHAYVQVAIKPHKDVVYFSTTHVAIAKEQSASI